jgi:type IV pilus assembly protein PilA
VSIVAKLRARRDGDDEQGFTLIELMVVVLIIAILIAIAIPTFLGARQRAQDKAAQSSLRNGLTAAKTIYTDKEDYTQATPGATGTLKGAEPSLDFAAGTADSTGPKDVSVDTPNDHQIVLAALSKSGKCFWMADETQGADAGTTFNQVGGSTDCAAGTPPTAGWSGDGFP